MSQLHPNAVSYHYAHTMKKVESAIVKHNERVCGTAEYKKKKLYGGQQATVLLIYRLFINHYTSGKVRNGAFKITHTAITAMTRGGQCNRTTYNHIIKALTHEFLLRKRRSKARFTKGGEQTYCIEIAINPDLLVQSDPPPNLDDIISGKSTVEIRQSENFDDTRKNWREYLDDRISGALGNT